MTPRSRSVKTGDVAAVLGDSTESPARPGLPRRPRFPMCEGVRDELARTGTAIDPFTGETLTRTDDE